MLSVNQLLEDVLFSMFSDGIDARYDDDEQLICVRVRVKNANAFLYDLAQNREALMRRINKVLFGECTLEFVNQFRDGDRNVYIVCRRVLLVQVNPNEQ